MPGGYSPPQQGVGIPPALQQFVSSVVIALQELAEYTPQPATKAPKLWKDGMIRLARKPWWPAAGQTADAWVYYDGVTRQWKLL